MLLKFIRFHLPPEDGHSMTETHIEVLSGLGGEISISVSHITCL